MLAAKYVARRNNVEIQRYNMMFCFKELHLMSFFGNRERQTAPFATQNINNVTS